MVGQLTHKVPLVPVSSEPSGDSLWLSMAPPALGLDPWNLLGLFFFQVLLLLLPPLTAGGGGQGPVPRVRYNAGKCVMVRKCGDGDAELDGVQKTEREHNEGEIDTEK